MPNFVTGDTVIWNAIRERVQFFLCERKGQVTHNKEVNMQSDFCCGNVPNGLHRVTVQRDSSEKGVSTEMTLKV